jgi:hypothetical protein
MKIKMEQLWAALKVAYDSLVRTYSPWLVSVVLGWLSTLLPVIPDDVKAFLALAVAFLAAVLWYAIARVYEILSGKVAKLLTFGLIKTKPASYLTALEAHADEQAAMSRTEK